MGELGTWEICKCSKWGEMQRFKRLKLFRKKPDFGMQLQNLLSVEGNGKETGNDGRRVGRTQGRHKSMLFFSFFGNTNQQIEIYVAFNFFWFYHKTLKCCSLFFFW